MMENFRKKVCIGICCYNEEKSIPEVYDRITKQMEGIKEVDYIILFEDNCSTDNSRVVIEALAKKDNHVKAIFNKTNFGLLKSGVNLKRNMVGDALIVINCDLQDPPEMIPDFIKGWLEGYDIVWGQKTNSKEGLLKYLCRKLFYKIISFFSDNRQYEQVTGFGLMDKAVVQAILPTQEQDPEIAARFLVGEYGFKMMLIPYIQDKRKYGKSSYNSSSYFSFAFLSLCATSIKPLRIMTLLGFFSAIISLICGVVFFLYKLTHWMSFSMGIAPIIIGLFFLSSIQLFCMGVLGEYLAAVLRKVTNKTQVIEEKRIGL